jgi:hypothetical protein
VTKTVRWTDEKTGRQYASLLPDGAPDKDAPKGVPLLTVDVDELGLPEPLATGLHNQLVARELWDLPTVKRKGGRGALVDALVCTLKGTAAQLMNLYTKEEENA